MPTDAFLRYSSPPDRTQFWVLNLCRSDELVKFGIMPMVVKNYPLVSQPASQPDDVTYPQCLLNEPSGRTSSNVTTIKNPLIPLRNLGLFKVSLQQQSSRLIGNNHKAGHAAVPKRQMRKISLLKSWRKSCLFEIGRKVIATYYYSSFSLACEVAVPPLSIITSGSSCQPLLPRM